MTKRAKKPKGPKNIKASRAPKKPNAPKEPIPNPSSNKKGEHVKKKSVIQPRRPGVILSMAILLVQFPKA